MLFSVIVPFYNREKFLLRTLRSISLLKHRPIQLILVDNNSTDNSLNVAMSFKRDFETKEFSVEIYTETVPGACAARNTGLHHATGKYVYFFDSDDEMSSSFLTDVCRTLQKGKGEADAVFSNINIIKNGICCSKTFFRNASVKEQILASPLSTQTMVLKNDFMRRIGGWNAKIKRWNDWELGVRVLLYGSNFHWMKNIYHRVYSHEDSITGCNFYSSYPDLLMACSYVEKDIKESEVKSKTKKLLLQVLAFRMFVLGAQIRREKPDFLIDELRQKTLLLLPDTKSRIVGKALYWYTLKGGRGAWRFARLFSLFVSSKK